MSVKDPNAGDLLDWTMTAAPTAEEVAEVVMPSPAAHIGDRAAQPHTRHFSRWMWLTLGGLTAIVMVGLMMFSWGNQRQVTEGVRQTFLAEEAAALNADKHTLANLTAPGYSNWLRARLILAEQGLAAPVPALLFSPVPQAGEIVSITTFAPDIMQADILRTFTGPEGAATRFVTAQFYQYQKGWKRTPTPPSFSGDLHQFEGRRLTVLYFDRDAELMGVLGPYLNEIVQGACAEWECADNFNLSLAFLEEAPAIESSTGIEWWDAPLAFTLLAYDDTAWLDASPLRLPAPHIIGTPADDVSREAFKQTLGRQILLYATQRYISGASEQTRNALAYALAARLAVRLGLDSPVTTEGVPQPSLMTDIHSLWDLRAAKVWDTHRRQDSLKSALVTLSTLLEEQPRDLEQRLFRKLHGHTDPRVWLADGLGMDYADVQTTLAEAGRAAMTAELPFGFEPTLALQCASGPQLYFEWQNATFPFISGPFFDGGIVWRSGSAVWSPDGNYLLLYVSGRYAVLNLSSGAITWLSLAAAEYAIQPRGWISNTTLAYLSQSELHFLDLTQPERDFPVFLAVDDYVLSPDRTRAAVVWNQPDGEGNGQITLMSATGGTLLNIDFGAAPVWTEDGSALMYAQLEQYLAGEGWQFRSSVKQAEFINGIRYIVAEGETLGSIAARYALSPTEILTINHLTSHLLLPGQNLILPARDTATQVVSIRYLLTSELYDAAPRAHIVSFTGSPDGQTLAVVLEAQADGLHHLLLANMAGSSNGEAFTTLLDTGVGNPQRLLRVNPDDSRLRVIVSEMFRFMLPPRFSADGQLLAVIAEQDGLPLLSVYDAVSGQAARFKKSVINFAWSSTGHRLAMTTEDGVFVLDDIRPSITPVFEDRPGTLLTEELCYGAWWRPTDSTLISHHFNQTQR